MRQRGADGAAGGYENSLGLLRACAALGLGLETTSARRPTLDELDTVYGHES
jgi:hypothetical protein